jgi:hypothetical protein
MVGLSGSNLGCKGKGEGTVGIMPLFSGSGGHVACIQSST